MNEIKEKLRKIYLQNIDKIPKYVSSRSNTIASVLVVLQYNSPNKSWNILLTKRSSTLKSFPGQISFPGGNMEIDDADEEAAALRETREEIGIDDLRVEIVARLPPQTVGMKLVHSCIGIIDESVDVISRVRLVDNNEVDSVFFAPVALFLSQEHFAAIPYEINKEGKQLQIYFPSFSISTPCVTTVNNEHRYDTNISAQVYGFTAIICVYTAILVLDQCPAFDGPQVRIRAQTSMEVFEDLIAMQEFVMRHFNIKHITVVSGARL